MSKNLLLTSIVFIIISIILGAFAAHALKEKLSPEALASFEVGVRYLMYQGLALLLFALNSDKFKDLLIWPSRLIILGTILFSGSIFILSTQTVLNVSASFLGPVTPIGGTLMITGWVLLLFKIVRNAK